MNDTAASDLKELMDAHDHLILVANALIPDSPELAEVIGHEMLAQAIGL